LVYIYIHICIFDREGARKNKPWTACVGGALCDRENEERENGEREITREVEGKRKCVCVMEGEKRKTTTACV